MFITLKGRWCHRCRRRRRLLYDLPSGMFCRSCGTHIETG